MSWIWLIMSEFILTFATAIPHIDTGICSFLAAKQSASVYKSLDGTDPNFYPNYLKPKSSIHICFVAFPHTIVNIRKMS